MRSGRIPHSEARLRQEVQAVLRQGRLIAGLSILQWATDPAAGVWETLTGNLVSSNTWQTLQLLFPIADHPKAFFRLAR